MCRRLDTSGLAVLIVRCARETRRSCGTPPASFLPSLPPPTSSPSSWTSWIRAPILRPLGSVALRSSPRRFASWGQAGGSWATAAPMMGFIMGCTCFKGTSLSHLFQGRYRMSSHESAPELMKASPVLARCMCTRVRVYVRYMYRHGSSKIDKVRPEMEKSAEITFCNMLSENYVFN